MFDETTKAFTTETFPPERDKQFPPDVFEPAKHADADAHLQLECVTAFVKRKIPAREMMLAPILPAQGLAMLFAKRGVGKTFVGLNIAYAVATGSDFLGWTASKPRKCLYVDGEMSAVDLQARLIRIMDSHEKKPAPDSLRLLAMTDQAVGVNLNLYERADQVRLDKHLLGVDFLVLDNISTLFIGGNENDAESWVTVQPWLIELRKRGVTVLLIHHASRGGTARGSSKREDVLDTVLHLKRPEGYKESEGARFEVHHEKHRHYFGKDAMPVEARLVPGTVPEQWIVTPVSEERDVARAIVAAARAEGKTLDQIAKETGIPRSTVGRYAKQANESDD